MSMGSSGRPLRSSGRFRRFAARHPVVAFLLLAVPIGIAGLTPFAGLSTRGVIRVAEIVILMLSPTLLLAAALHAPRTVAAVWRILADRRADNYPQPTSLPIEQLAADLRRLLWQHDTVRRSTDVPMRARRLRALEGAISDRAMQAASALEVPHPESSAYGGLDKPQLRRLLCDLAAAGLVLPHALVLLGSDGRL
jgi:hypothetical protein